MALEKIDDGLDIGSVGALGEGLVNFHEVALVNGRLCVGDETDCLELGDVGIDCFSHSGLVAQLEF